MLNYSSWPAQPPLAPRSPSTLATCSPCGCFLQLHFRLGLGLGRFRMGLVSIQPLSRVWGTTCVYPTARVILVRLAEYSCQSSFLCRPSWSFHIRAMRNYLLVYDGKRRIWCTMVRTFFRFVLDMISVEGVRASFTNHPCLRFRGR